MKTVFINPERCIGCLQCELAGRSDRRGQLAGDIRAAGVYRSLMLRRAPVGQFGRRLVEPGFGSGDLVTDALRRGAPVGY